MLSARRECPHRATAASASVSLESALATAEARCLSAGERWTASRRRTYELLVADRRPSKAYDLIARFKDHDATTKPPTVYRSLDFLMGLGLVHRIESLNVFVACAAPEPFHCPEFLICDCCGVAEEFSAEFVSTIPFAARGWFEVRHIIVEVHGTCVACREA
jgi:Fur family zinc uptake transcriptional regulator